MGMSTCPLTPAEENKPHDGSTCTYHEPKALLQGGLVAGRARRHAGRSWWVGGCFCVWCVRVDVVSLVVYVSRGTEPCASKPFLTGQAKQAAAPVGP